MKIKYICSLFAVAILLTSCGGLAQTDTIGEELRDVRVSGRDDTPALIIHMPNGYSNVAFKCNGTTGVYTTRNANGRAVTAVADDGACPRG